MEASNPGTNPANRTFFIATPHGALVAVAPEHAVGVAERLARHIPDYAVGHVAVGDYSLILPRHAEAVRQIVLATTENPTQLWAESYAAALALLARDGRGAAGLAVAA